MRAMRSGIFFAVLILMTGCTSQSNISAITISEAGAIALPTSAAEMSLKVVALANGSAEIISALGLKSILVGRDIASTDADLASIPIVTSGHQLIPEKVIATQANLVLIDSSTGPANAITSLRKAGIPIAEISQRWTLQDISKKVEDVGTAIGRSDLAAKLNAKINGAITSSHISGSPRIAFLYLRGTSAIYLMGGKGSGADSLIDAIGGIDVGAKTLPNPFNPMTSEVLAQANPEIILLMTKGLESVGGVEGLIALPGIAQTDAGKKKRVIAVDDSLLLSFGPRTPDLIHRLSIAVQKVMAQ